MQDASAGPVTEQEIEAAEKLRSDGEFGLALAQTQALLVRAHGDETRMRLLFDVVYCAAPLDRPELIESVLLEFDKLPRPDISRVLVNMGRAWAETSLGRPANAVHLLDAALDTGLFEAEDMHIHKYQLCLYKGEALLHMRRATDALEWLDRAHEMFPTIDAAKCVEEKKIFNWVEPSIQINRANCLLAFERHEDSFCAAERVLNFDNPELAALALQYMAECRTWQARFPEALKIYARLEEKLPCRLVDGRRVATGVANCIGHLERHPEGVKPS